MGGHVKGDVVVVLFPFSDLNSALETPGPYPCDTGMAMT